MRIISKPFYWYRSLVFRMTGTETDRMLTLSMAFSAALVVARVAYTGRMTFIWLLWNLFLAWLPYAISSWMTQQQTFFKNKYKFAAIGFIWLLFIPNSFYIL